MANIKNIVNELDNLFKIFNYTFFSNEVEKPVIVVQTNGKEGNVLGWCTTRRIWTDTEENKDYYEITVCAEFLSRGVVEICGTLLHEMAHLYNLQKGIQDCSRGGTYHNSKFKEIAEKAGLDVSYDKKYGWAFTKPTEATEKVIQGLKLNQSDFSLARKSSARANVGGDEKKKQSMRKYICPMCGLIVRATKDLTGKLLCIDCEAEFVEENTTGLF